MADDINNDWKYCSYQHPLKVSLQAAIDQWKDDRKQSWTSGGGLENIVDFLEEPFADEPIQREHVFQIVEGLAKAIIKTSENLTKSQAMKRFSKIIDIFYENPELYIYTAESLEIYLAEKIIEKTNEAGRNLAFLEVELSIMENLCVTQATIDFLQLVTRSYIWGFDSECIILCRSVMESTFKDKINYEVCEKVLGKRFGKQQDYALVDRIAVARRENLIDDEIVKLATQVRVRANTVLHKDSKVTEKVKETITETLRVISFLTGKGDPFLRPHEGW